MPVKLRKLASGMKKHEARGAGYAWLADQLGIKREDYLFHKDVRRPL